MAPKSSRPAGSASPAYPSLLSADRAWLAQALGFALVGTALPACESAHAGTPPTTSVPGPAAQPLGGAPPPMDIPGRVGPGPSHPGPDGGSAAEVPPCPPKRPTSVDTEHRTKGEPPAIDLPRPDAGTPAVPPPEHLGGKPAAPDLPRPPRPPPPAVKPGLSPGPMTPAPKR